MLAAKNRLTKDKEFDNVYKKGESSYDKLLGVKAVVNNLNKNRFGIITGLKISKKATERNRIKRRVREVIGSELGKLKTGFDVIIISLPAIKDANYQDIEKSIIKHFKKLGLYR